MYYSTPDNTRLKHFRGRKILLTVRNPFDFTPFDPRIHLHAVNLAIGEHEEKDEIRKRYAEIDWDETIKDLKDDDVFIVGSKNGHLSILQEYLNQHDVQLKELKEIKRGKRNIKGSSWEKDKWRGALGYALDEKPLTKPVLEGQLVPFINANGDLVIPSKCDERYQWWKENGMSIPKLVERFQGRIPGKVYQKLVRSNSYATH